MNSEHSNARRRSLYSSLWVFILTITLNIIASGQSDEYQITQEMWRADREDQLTADDGWLTLSALHFLRPGENTFGTNLQNDLVLPEGPASAGVFELRENEVYARSTNPLMVNGKPVLTAKLYPTEGQPMNLTIGDLTIWVHPSGDRLAIRIRDMNSQIRKKFTGLSWFPIDVTYRVQGRFIQHDKPLYVDLPNSLGDIEQFTSHGSVILSLKGQELRMLPVTSANGRLWFIFKDLTSGSETYSAARFVYAPPPNEEGWTTVDFNKAYNPPCAFNPHTTCPLPPESNRLGVRVEAGEKNYR